ncbi:MAG: hypothetical protein IT281_03570 [Ignavibacteria bacterium]|nr:hypothetical protein [Ignavibacteria bacterium]
MCAVYQFFFGGFLTITAGDALTAGTYFLDLTADGFNGVEDYTALILNQYR